MKPPRISTRLTALLAVWLALTAGGLTLLEAHHAQPGDSGTPTDWPMACPITLDPLKPTMVFFLHPLCPCSWASVAELASIRSDLSGRFASHLVVYQPRSRSPEWQRSTPVLDQASLPGWQRWDDEAGELARRFGVRTSGHILVFNPRGELLFSGGVTPGRGQRAPLGSLDALLAGIEVGSFASPRSPVFGCSIRDSDLSGVVGERP